MKYEIVELLDDSCLRFVSEHERTVPLHYAEFMELWEMLDCFHLGTVGDSENEQSAWFQHLPDILERPAYRRHTCSKTSEEMMKSFPINSGAIFAAAISSLGSLW